MTTMISLHLPKTAGTSFRRSLIDHFGAAYRDDYDDAAISKPPFRRKRKALLNGLIIARQGLPGIDCVHGHFLPVKYRRIGRRQDLIFVTWMRDPVARMVSHYHYWQQSYDALTAAAHHRQVVEQGWTLEQFCLHEKFRNIYSQYLWGFAPEKFAFIGISEHYVEDLQDFSRRFLSTEVAPRHENSSDKAGLHAELGADLIRQIRKFHAKDILLYERALAWRQVRLAARG